MNDFKQNALALGLSTLLVVGLSMLTYQLGYQRGEVRAKGEAQAREAQINADHAEALLHATAREQATERTLRTELTALLLPCALALCACQSPSQVALRTVEATRAQVPDLPVEIGTKRVPNLRLNMDLLLLPSPTPETTASGSSTPALTPTTP